MLPFFIRILLGMHSTSLKHMKLNINKYLTPCKILDVGSVNIRKKGCYRDILPTGYDYVGIDLVAGPNVDIVMEDPYIFPLASESFDAVITGQCFEHVKNPFKLIEECSRILRNKGHFLGVAPSKWPIHRYPVDCWRFLPDGWESLFEHVGLSKIETYLYGEEPGHEDCWGIAIK